MTWVCETPECRVKINVKIFATGQSFKIILCWSFIGSGIELGRKQWFIMDSSFSLKIDSETLNVLSLGRHSTLSAENKTKEKLLLFYKIFYMQEFQT